jgi:trehalose-6-phosphatase
MTWDQDITGYRRSALDGIFFSDCSVTHHRIEKKNQEMSRKQICKQLQEASRASPGLELANNNHLVQLDYCSTNASRYIITAKPSSLFQPLIVQERDIRNQQRQAVHTFTPRARDRGAAVLTSTNTSYETKIEREKGTKSGPKIALPLT